MSTSTEETDISNTPPEILKLAVSATQDLLPSKSRGKYEAAYKNFRDWQTKKKTTSFSENVILVYFTELAKKYKSSSLWAIYSMLKSTLNIHHKIQIENYMKLQAFIKRTSEGYRPKKANTFTPDQVNKFIKEAPDQDFLLTKVAMIMGPMGACRCNELHLMRYDDIQDYNGALIVNIPFTKTKTSRSFTVSGEFYDICKKYMVLRPSNVESPNFFLNYQKGKCTKQVVGINKLGFMGKQIATFLGLKDVDSYTGHCLRRSSATICVSGGGDINAVKKIGGWKSTTIAEGYIDNIQNKLDRGNKILNEIKKNDKPCTITSSSSSTSTNIKNITEHYELVGNTTPSAINFTNCNNITVNYYANKN